MDKITDTLQSLRDRRHDIEQKQIELTAERDRISYDAMTGNAAARKRLDQVNAQLSALSLDISSIDAALKEAGRRQLAEEQAEQSRRRKADAVKAEGIIAEVEALAVTIDAAQKTARDTATLIEAKLGQIRGLVQAGPTVESIRIHLRRAVTTSVMNSPLHVAHIAPDDRATMVDVATLWARSIRRAAEIILEKTAAKAA